MADAVLVLALATFVGTVVGALWLAPPLTRWLDRKENDRG